MKFLRDNEFGTLPYGIFVTLTKDSSIQQTVFETTKPLPYRTEVTIALPADLRSEWVSQVTKALAIVQAGDRWTVHFDWDNVSAFFTPTQLACIEAPFRTVAFRCHASPPILYSTSDTEYMEQQQRAEVVKKNQAKRNRRQYLKSLKATTS